MGRSVMGAANDVHERERIAAVERHYRDHVGRGSLPAFWPDSDVRRFLIAQHGFLTIDMARDQLIAGVGRKRTPGRSSIGRFFQALDAFWKARG